MPFTAPPAFLIPWVWTDVLQLRHPRGPGLQFQDSRERAQVPVATVREGRGTRFLSATSLRGSSHLYTFPVRERLALGQNCHITAFKANLKQHKIKVRRKRQTYLLSGALSHGDFNPRGVRETGDGPTVL